jgi:hypothetical protein
MALLKVALAIALALFPLSAQVLQTMDLSTTHGRKTFYVVLASRDGSSTGHAFVVWGIEDGARKMSSIEALGLYPESDGANCAALMHSVSGSGRVMDEMANHSVQGITYALIVKVDESDFRRSRTVAREWDCRHQFSLLGRDCVEFLRAVGLSLHLKMPGRGLTRWTPQAYVRALQERASNGVLISDRFSLTGSRAE